MSKNIKKVLVVLFLLAIITTALCLNTKAATLKETTATDDGFDTIESGTIIIGVTKFTPDYAKITGVDASTAGANDLLVYTSINNGSTDGYTYPEMYYFEDGDWYKYKEDGYSLEYLPDGFESLDIYYVNNELKEGISLPSYIPEPVKHTVFFVDGDTVTNQEVVEGAKINLPTIEVEEQLVGKQLVGKWLNGETKLNAGDEVTITADTVYVAKREWDGEVVVSNESELKEALSDSEVKTITLASDIENISSKVAVANKVTIDGNGYALKFNEITRGQDEENASALTITSDGTTVKDLTVEMTAIDGWNGNYGIQVYNATDVVLNSVTVAKADGGIRLNGSSVTLKGTTKLYDNEFGGIEVSKGTAANLSNSVLTVSEGATIEMNNEVITRPVIWIEMGTTDNKEAQGEVKGIENTGYIETEITKEDGKCQKIYYSSSEIAATAEVSSLEDLTTALATEQVATIKLTSNVTTTDKLEIGADKTVTIDLNGNTITNSTLTSGGLIENNGTLTLKGNGTIEATGAHVILNNSDAELTIEDGTYDAQGHQRAAIFNQGGTVTINGGKIIRSCENGSSSSQSGGNSYYNVVNNGTMIINGGEISQTGKFSSMIRNGGYDTEASLTINNGTFDGGLNTVKNDEHGILTISGGTFKNNYQAVVLNWNVATINGGVFDGTGCRYVFLNGNYNSDGATGAVGELIINDGDFKGGTEAYMIGAHSATLAGSTVRINGGTFEKSLESQEILQQKVTINGEETDLDWVDAR